ncbi:MAG: transporter [Gemmatimonadales bacterium]
MSYSRLIALLAIGLAASGVRPLAAQIDYRNLDDDRPVRTEDAYPIERFAFELLLPYEYENAVAGERVHVTAPELAYGIISNGQIGIELPFAAFDRESGTEWGFGGPRIFGLYNFNTEGPLLPALAVRADLSLPVGDLAGDDPQLTLKGIATRSWGASRIHLNAAVTLGADQGGPVVEPEPNWALTLAVDRTLFRPSLLLVGEVAVLESSAAAPTEITAGVGARYQLTPTLVLDLGASRRLREGVGPDLGLTLGLSHAFAFAGLLPGSSR